MSEPWLGAWKKTLVRAIYTEAQEELARQELSDDNVRTAVALCFARAGFKSGYQAAALTEGVMLDLDEVAVLREALGRMNRDLTEGIYEQVEAIRAKLEVVHPAPNSSTSAPT